MEKVTFTKYHYFKATYIKYLKRNPNFESVCVYIYIY